MAPAVTDEHTGRPEEVEAKKASSPAGRQKAPNSHENDPFPLGHGQNAAGPLLDVCAVASNAQDKARARALLVTVPDKGAAMAWLQMRKVV
jgi:hypothetical protein